MNGTSDRAWSENRQDRLWFRGHVTVVGRSGTAQGCMVTISDLLENLVLSRAEAGVSESLLRLVATLRTTVCFYA